MIVSIPGILVCIGLLIAGRLMGNAAIIGLFLSLALSSTAIATLTALGGSSPQIFTVFSGLLILSAALKPRFFESMLRLFRNHGYAVIISVLAAYAVAGAIIYPRLFAGVTTTFTVVNKAILQLPLSPTTGNITQTSYFVFGIITFFAMRSMLTRRADFHIALKGLFAYAIANSLLAAIDLAGDIAGMGDVLTPIRTASYAMTVNHEIQGFARIIAGHPEASSFAAHGLACIAFSFVYWRATGSTLSLGVTAFLAVMLILSTSTTAYAGLGMLGAILGVSIAATFLNGRLKVQDLTLFALVFMAFAAAAALYLYNHRIFDPLIDLFRVMVLEKGDSSSGRERAYWNSQSMKAFVDTLGFGMGLGSSRSSSWLVSVISQLGVIGTLLMGALVALLVRGTGGIRLEGYEDVYALAAGARALAIGWLCGNMISGSGADPGLPFFLSLAIVLACRDYLARQRQILRAAAG